MSALLAVASVTRSRSPWRISAAFSCCSFSVAVISSVCAFMMLVIAAFFCSAILVCASRSSPANALRSAYSFSVAAFSSPYLRSMATIALSFSVSVASKAAFAASCASLSASACALVKLVIRATSSLARRSFSACTFWALAICFCASLSMMPLIRAEMRSVSAPLSPSSSFSFCAAAFTASFRASVSPPCLLALDRCCTATAAANSASACSFFSRRFSFSVAVISSAIALRSATVLVVSRSAARFLSMSTWFVAVTNPSLLTLSPMVS